MEESRIKRLIYGCFTYENIISMKIKYENARPSKVSILMPEPPNFYLGGYEFPKVAFVNVTVKDKNGQDYEYYLGNMEEAGGCYRVEKDGFFKQTFIAKPEWTGIATTQNGTYTINSSGVNKLNDQKLLTLDTLKSAFDSLKSIPERTVMERVFDGQKLRNL